MAAAGAGSTAVFVYGTLLADEVVALLGRVPAAAPARVAGFHRYAVHDRLYPGVSPLAGSEVVGKVLLDISPKEQAILDEFEDVEYVRQAVGVTLLVRPPCAPLIFAFSTVSQVRDSGDQTQVMSQAERPPVMQAHIYVWAKQDDERLHGTWDYEAWRRDHLHEYVKMCGLFITEISRQWGPVHQDIVNFGASLPRAASISMCRRPSGPGE
eukprot:SM000141S00841  [mRNA]  locus=s141:70416:72518:+ [translate_table: standard]